MVAKKSQSLTNEGPGKENPLVVVKDIHETVDNTEKAVTSLHTILSRDPLMRQRVLPCSHPPPVSRAFLFIRVSKNFILQRISNTQENARGWIGIRLNRSSTARGDIRKDTYKSSCVPLFGFEFAGESFRFFRLDRDVYSLDFSAKKCNIPNALLDEPFL